MTDDLSNSTNLDDFADRVQLLGNRRFRGSFGGAYVEGGSVSIFSLDVQNPLLREAVSDLNDSGYPIRYVSISPIHIVLDGGKVVAPNASVLPYRVSNDSEIAVTFGADYQFEAHRDGAWRRVALPNWVFPAIGFQLEPTKTSDTLMARMPPSGLTPGRYRLSKMFDVSVHRPRSGRPRLEELPRMYTEFIAGTP